MKDVQHGVVASDRWGIGHRTFFLLLQGLIVTLTRFGKALDENDLDEADRDLGAATTLMWGAAAVMRFTGDFDVEAYESEVRPSMAPPRTTTPFSGLMSRDHKHLVRLITQLRPRFKTLPPRLERGRRDFEYAFAAVYESHVFVCERFGGGEMASLRSAKASDKPESPGEATKAPEKTAVEILRTFAENRVGLVKGPDRKPLGCPFHKK